MVTGNGKHKTDEDPIVHLVRHAATTPAEAVPEPVLTYAADLLLDTLGCALAGSTAAGIEEVRRTLDLWGGHPQATVLGSAERLSVPWAAMVNSAMAHARDFDDTHDPALNHGCVTLVPALLAVAEASCGAGPGGISRALRHQRAVSGIEFLAALAVGLDVANRLGLAFIRYLHTGWLPTTLWGPIACAAAVGRCLGLDETGMRNAFGLAYAQVHGNRQALADGALAKRLQPGFSAVAGIQAAFLAQSGVDGARDILHGRFGVPELYAHGCMDMEHISEGVGEHYETLNVSIKPYPSCRCTHPVIDAALDLRGTHGIAWEDIEAGEIRLPPKSMGQVGRPFLLRGNPTVDAQFSATFTAALAFIKGCPRLGDFEADAVRANRAAQALAQRFTVREFEPEASGLVPVEMRVRLRDSQTRETRVDQVRGSPALPLGAASLRAKFEDCIAHARHDYPAATRERIVRCVRDLRRLKDVTALMSALRDESESV